MRLAMKIKNLFLAITILGICLSSSTGSCEELSYGYGPYPTPASGYVTDIADRLTAEEEELIEKWLWQVESRKNIEMAVVIINSTKDYPGTDNGSIESFATGLFNAYKIGNKAKNDGILFLVAVSDRKSRIELGAYYGNDHDGISSNIMEKSIIPHFKSGKYNKGILSGTRAIMKEFAGMAPLQMKNLVIISLVIILLMFIAASLWVNGKKGWAWATIGILITLIIMIIRTGITIAEHMPKTSSDSWSSGGFGGGFGGGFSGGGGATGSW